MEYCFKNVYITNRCIKSQRRYVNVFNRHRGML